MFPSTHQNSPSSSFPVAFWYVIKRVYFSFIPSKPWNVNLFLLCLSVCFLLWRRDAMNEDVDGGGWDRRKKRLLAGGMRSSNERTKYWGEEVSDYFSIFSLALHYYVWFYSERRHWERWRRQRLRRISSGASTSLSLAAETTTSYPAKSSDSTWKHCLPCTFV